MLRRLSLKIYLLFFSSEYLSLWFAKLLKSMLCAYFYILCANLIIRSTNRKMLSIQVENLLNKSNPRGSQYLNIVVKKLCSEFMMMNESGSQAPRIDKKMIQKVNRYILSIWTYFHLK